MSAEQKSEIPKKSTSISLNDFPFFSSGNNASAIPAAQTMGDCDPSTGISLRKGHTETATAELLESKTEQGKSSGELGKLLFKAIEEKNLPSAQSYLIKRAPVNCRRRSGETLLIAAVKSGYFEMVALLLAARAAVDKFDDDETTPLVFASINGSLNIAALLLAAKADVNHQTKSFISQHVLDGTDPDYFVPLVDNPFERDFKYGLSTSQPPLLLEPHFLFHQTENFTSQYIPEGTAPGYFGPYLGHKALLLPGNTALQFASFHGHKDIVMLLLAANAQVDKGSDEDEEDISRHRSATYLAAKRVHPHIVAKLLQSPVPLLTINKRITATLNGVLEAQRLCFGKCREYLGYQDFEISRFFRQLLNEIRDADLRKNLVSQIKPFIRIRENYKINRYFPSSFDADALLLQANEQYCSKEKFKDFSACSELIKNQLNQDIAPLVMEYLYGTSSIDDAILFLNKRDSLIRALEELSPELPNKSKIPFFSTSRNTPNSIYHVSFSIFIQHCKLVDNEKELYKALEAHCGSDAPLDAAPFKTEIYACVSRAFPKLVAKSNESDEGSVASQGCST